MYSIIIHGASSKANSDSNSEVALSTVQALTSYTLITLDVLGVYPQPFAENNTQEGSGTIKIDLTKIREKYEIDVKPEEFPSITTIQNIRNVLKMKYKFLSTNDYTTTPSILTASTNVIDVVLTGFSVESDPPQKHVKISFEKRKAYA